MAQQVKNPPAMQETQVRSLGRKDHLEEEKGNPLHYSCLENPMDGGTMGSERVVPDSASKHAWGTKKN